MNPEVTVLKEYFVILGAMIAICTTVATLGGTWAIMRFTLTRNSEQIKKIEESIAKLVCDGEERSARVQHVEDCGMTREACESWMFRGPGAIKPIIEDHGQRITKLETVCNLRHGPETLNRG